MFPVVFLFSSIASLTSYKGKMAFLSTKVSILIVLLSFGIRWLSRTYFPNQPCDGSGQKDVAIALTLSTEDKDRVRNATIMLHPCQVFSETYNQAKSRFRELVEQLQKKQSNVLLDQLVVYVDQESGNEYTTEVAVIPGTVPGMVVHSSGVHGVEGYAGSAIQLAFLRLLLQQQEQKLSSSSSRLEHPTVVLVHAVNPYGMAHYRRFNEHNVDLNRNGLSEEQFQTFAGPTHYNRAAYDMFDESLFNPDVAPTWKTAFVDYLVKGILALIQHGQPAIKAAMVGAQYHKPTGIFYGGKQQAEPSLQLLRDWWFNKGLVLLQDNHVVTWIDVHTGLGPTGMDTLLATIDIQKAAEELKWFPGSLNPLANQQAKSVAQGYEQVKGTIKDFFMTTLFDEHHKKDALIVTQEFGTMPTILVGNALVVENAAYHHLPAKDALKWARSTTLTAFYPQSKAWRKQILQRGIRLLQQAMERSNTLSVAGATPSL